MKPTDTSQRSYEKQIQIYRKMGPEKRLQTALDLAETSRKLLAEGVRQRHPDYGEKEIMLASIRLMIEKDLFLAAYSQAKDIVP